MTFASRPLDKLQTTWGLSFNWSRAEQSELLPLDVCADQAEQLLGLFREAVPVRSLETSVPEFARVHAIVLCRLSSGFVKVLLIGLYVFSGNPLAPASLFGELAELGVVGAVFRFPGTSVSKSSEVLVTVVHRVSLVSLLREVLAQELVSVKATAASQLHDG